LVSLARFGLEIFLKDDSHKFHIFLWTIATLAKTNKQTKIPKKIHEVWWERERGGSGAVGRTADKLTLLSVVDRPAWSLFPA
jgi:hypothetical protein